MNKIKTFIKDTYKYLIVYIILFIISIIPLPYYINAPGGLINISDRITVDKGYKTKGSLNLSYVSEYDGRVISLLIAIFNKNWDINKKNKQIVNNEHYIDKLALMSAYNNATYVAYKKANKKVDITSNNLYVEYIFKESKTNLQVGDKIEYIDNKKVIDRDSLNNIINNYHENDKISITVKKNNKEEKRTATLIKKDDRLMIGISLLEFNELKASPSIKYNYKQDESGPSGGLMLSLAIYNSLVKDDITHSKIIVGTGTIDKDGKVGPIDGVEYKIKGVAKKHVDLFFVPKDNLKEALKVKKKNHYKIKIVGVSTFDEALNYLLDLEND